jgi:hypothetical protein
MSALGGNQTYKAGGMKYRKLERNALLIMSVE